MDNDTTVICGRCGGEVIMPPKKVSVDYRFASECKCPDDPAWVRPLTVSEAAMQVIEDAGSKPMTAFMLTIRPEPGPGQEPKKAAVPSGLLLPLINSSVINRVVSEKLASRRK